MSEKPKLMKLTVMQRLFAHEWAISKKGREAAIKAGFSPKNAAQVASNMLNNPTYKPLQDYLAGIMGRQYKRLNITAEKVLKNIEEIGDRCMQKVEITDSDGKPIGKYVFKEGGALKAQELLGRYLKLFDADEGRETSVNVTVMPQIIVKGKPFTPKIGKQ